MQHIFSCWKICWVLAKCCKFWKAVLERCFHCYLVTNGWLRINRDGSKTGYRSYIRSTPTAIQPNNLISKENLSFSFFLSTLTWSSSKSSSKWAILWFSCWTKKLRSLPFRFHFPVTMAVSSDLTKLQNKATMLGEESVGQKEKIYVHFCLCLDWFFPELSKITSDSRTC